MSLRASAAIQHDWTSAFEQRLRELSWIDGRTITIEYRWADGRSDRAAETTAEFVRLNVNVIVTHATANVIAAKQATSAIPIVFAVAGDPIANNLVESLARPGGKVTGLSIQGSDLAGKRLELFREAVPGFTRLSFLLNLGNLNSALELREIERAARMFGFQLDTLEFRRMEDLVAGIEALKDRVQVLYIPQDPLINSNRLRINNLAADARMPTFFSSRDSVEAGGLMSYGPNLADLFRRTAEYVDKILRGAKPTDMPVEQPTRFDLVINLRTAKALGLTIPEAMLARADEVIE